MTKDVVTLGVEHEWADIPLDVELPKGYGRDAKDYTIVNSNGIANDPSGKLYRFGGEINTPPTTTAVGQQEVLDRLLKLLPTAKVNYRSNLHVHVRWPGLKQDLAMLKRVQGFIHKVMPWAFESVLPYNEKPVMDWMASQFATKAEFDGAIRRWKRRRVSHQTLLGTKRLERQLDAKSIDTFFQREVPAGDTGKPLWHMQPRLCVNLRQLLQTDTVEFRHFPGTLDPKELFACIEWCVEFLDLAQRDDQGGLPELFARYPRERFPKFPTYCHWQELRYRATCQDGSIPRERVKKNIAAIEAGTFDSKGVVPFPVLRDVS